MINLPAPWRKDHPRTDLFALDDPGSYGQIIIPRVGTGAQITLIYLGPLHLGYRFDDVEPMRQCDLGFKRTKILFIDFFIEGIRISACSPERFMASRSGFDIVQTRAIGLKWNALCAKLK